MSTTISNLTFEVDSIINLQGLTDIDGAANAAIGEIHVPIDSKTGSFEFTISAITTVGSYPLTISILDSSGAEIGTEEVTLVITEAATPAPTTNEPSGNTPVQQPTTNEVTTMSTEAQKLIDGQSAGPSYISRLDGLDIPSDTDNIKPYPGSMTGFAPIKGETNSGTSAHEFKIMPDDKLAENPSAGYTGGRGTGNPDDFGKYPYRGLMKDTRGEFFTKDGDFDPTTAKPYPLGRTGDILENAVYPAGFTSKDEKGYSTSTTRGGVTASPFPTGGITF